MNLRDYFISDGLQNNIATLGEKFKVLSPAAFHTGHVWDLFYSFCMRVILKNPYQHSTPYAEDTSVSSSNENPLQFLEDLKRELERILI